MKLKHSLKWVLLPASLVSTTIPAVTFFSCGNKEIKDETVIACDEPILIVENHEVQFDVSIKNCPSSSVTIKLLNDVTEKLSLKSTSLSVDQGHALVDVSIDSSVDKTQLFTFDLEISYSSYDEKPVSKILYELSILYTKDPGEQDLIVPLSKYAKMTPSRKLTYDLLLIKKPQSDIMFEITKDVSHMLSLDVKVVPAIVQENYYLVRMSISVDEKQTESDWLFFDVAISFRNHFGDIQQTTITDFLAYIP